MTQQGSDDDSDVRTAALVIIATVVAGFGLYFGRDLFQPIAIAILLAISFRPPVRAMERVKIPTALAAAVVVLGFLCVLILIGYALAAPLKSFIETAPQSFSAAQDKLARLRRPVMKVTEAAKQIEQAAQGPSTQP